MRKLVAIGTFLLIIVSLTFLPRLLSLSAHWASDETLWMLRSRDFFFAMESGKFADTHIAYHPGVTTCWLGSISIWNRYQHDLFPKSWFYSREFLSPEMLANIRLPIAIASGILILVAGFLLYRLFNSTTAGIGTLFLAIEPFLLSESRRAHTDVLMSLFLFLSLLLWLYYLESETPHRRVLIFSGICAESHKDRSPFVMLLRCFILRTSHDTFRDGYGVLLGCSRSASNSDSVESLSAEVLPCTSV